MDRREVQTVKFVADGLVREFGEGAKAIKTINTIVQASGGTEARVLDLKRTAEGSMREGSVFKKTKY